MSQNQINAKFQPIFEQFRKQVPRYMYPEEACKSKFLNVKEILDKFQTTLLTLLGAVTLLLLISYSVLLPPDVFMITQVKQGDPNALIGSARDAMRAVDGN